MIKNIKIDNLDDQTRIDRWLKRNFSSLSQSFIEKNLRKGLIKLNHNKVQAKYKVVKNDIINIFNYSENIYSSIIEKTSNKKIPNKILKKFRDSIIFENKDFMILNKWDNITTQGESNFNISIDDIIKKISQQYNLVHRLDKETSGLLIISKNIKTTKAFGKLFREQKIEKTYVAVCHSMPKNNESIVRLNIPSKINPDKSSLSITKYKVVLNQKKSSVILFKPLTGKTHQLRIVSQNIGSPIIGDNKYNKYNKYNLEKLKLNAYFLKFVLNGKDYIFKSLLPNHFFYFFDKKLSMSKIDKYLSSF